MAEWERIAVAELERDGTLLVQDGNHGNDRPRPDEFVPEGVAFIRAADMRGGRVDFDGAERINDTAARRIRKGIGRPGDVLLSHKGTVGRVAFAPDDSPPFVCSPQTTFWRSLNRNRLDRTFLRFFLVSPDFVRQLDSRKSESDMAPYVSLTEQRRLTVLLPPLGVQRAIAGVLGALEDKIESNRRLVRLSEAVGRAELARELAGSGGEPWEHAWPEVPLGSALSLIETGDRPKGGVAGISGGVPSVGAESIVAPGIFDFSKTKFVPREYFERMKRGVLSSGDVLLYKDGGTPGNFIPKVSMYQDGFPFDEAVLNSHVYRLRIAQPYSQGFLYYWLSSERLLDEMWLRGTGAAIPSLNSTNVKGLPLAVPPEDRLRKVLPIVDDLLALLHRAACQQRTLEQLRDALLPELLSGRLRVREAEKVLEDVV